MARDGIRPPIPALEFVRIALEGGNSAVVAIVPKSWNPPHQVIFQKDYRFYTRGSAGKQHLDVDELRHIVLLSQEIGERLRQFRATRVGDVITGDTPVDLLPGARQILHFVPLAAFAAGETVDLNAVLADREQFIETMNRGGSMRHNVDGLLAYSPSSEVHNAYSQLFRNGTLEIVAFRGLNMNGEALLPSLSFEKDIFEQSRAALAVIKSAGVAQPIAIMLSFTGIHGWQMGIRDDWGTRGHHGGFDRDPLLIPELILQDLQTNDIPRLVKPLVDATWNAAGFPKSDYYDKDGNWVGDKRG